MDKTAVFIGSFEKREKKSPGIVEGRAIVFNTVADIGWYDEIIDSHALDKADLRDVRLCLNHDTSFVYARSRNNNENSTMQLMVKEQGMDIRANLDVENSPLAQSLDSAIERGDIDKMSFMFVVNRDEWSNLESDHPTRTILEIGRVLEVSAVTFPAYEATSIQARGLSDALESAKTSLESVKAAKRELELAKAKLKMKARI